MDNTVVFAEKKTVAEKGSERVKNGYLNIYYIVKGGCEASLGKKKMRVGEGCALAVKSCNSFIVFFDGKTEYLYAALKINEGNDKKKNRSDEVLDGYYGVLYDAMSLAVKKFEYGAYERQEDFEGLALEIIADIDIPQINTGNLTREIIDVLRKKAWDENFCLEEYLRSLPYAYDYLRRAFQKETGKTPLAYITDLRLNFAAARLRAGKTEIKELSRRAGIKDSLYFSRIFKKKFGLSPLEYAKKYEEGN